MKLQRLETPNKWPSGNKLTAIVIHWWDDPKKKPTLKGVVSWLTNPQSQVSAHYVVSDDIVFKLMSETDMAWHALEANQYAIGIEVDPNTPGSTYETVAELVRDIRSRYGNLPLIRHRDVPGVSTDCPGTLDVELIERLAQGDDMFEGKSAQQWAAETKVATKIAETRAKYLASMALAAGINPDHVIEQADVEKAAKLIDDRNKTIAALKKQVEGVSDSKAVEALKAIKEALAEV